jgi:CheY-like chemotaxis protein
VVRTSKADAAHSPSPRLAMSRSVLIADDNFDAAESLAMLIDGDGHRVMTAHDGEAAVQMFAERKPDVALLDIGMPKLDGYEVARRIRAMPQGGSALLIAVTGWGQAGDRTRSAEAGFDHHLTKPVDYDVLAKLISAKKSRLRVVPPAGSARLG